MNAIISTRFPQLLPEIEILKKKSQIRALLDVIFIREEYVREYFFCRNWQENVDLATIDNGQGDNCFIYFGQEGVFITGLGHESALSPYGEYGQVKEIFNKVPEAFSSAMNHPDLFTSESSFCIWRESDDEKWNVGDIPFPFENDDTEKTGLSDNPGVVLDYIDGSAELLYFLSEKPQDYIQKLTDDGEPAPDLEALEAIYAYEPLSGTLLNRLNPELTIENISAELEEIGYPLHIIEENT